MEQDLNAVTLHWYDRTRIVEKADFTRCALFRRRHVALGCVTIVCTSMLGVLSNLSPDHALLSVQIFGLNVADNSKVLLTILAPVLTALVQAPTLYLKEASFVRDSDEASGEHRSTRRPPSSPQLVASTVGTAEAA